MPWIHESQKLFGWLLLHCKDAPPDGAIHPKFLLVGAHFPGDSWKAICTLLYKRSACIYTSLVNFEALEWTWGVEFTCDTWPMIIVNQCRVGDINAVLAHNVVTVALGGVGVTPALANGSIPWRSWQSLTCIKICHDTPVESGVCHISASWSFPSSLMPVQVDIDILQPVFTFHI